MRAESGSYCSRSISESSDYGHVLETPVSKQGKIEFYLGKWNTKGRVLKVFSIRYLRFSNVSHQ